MRKRRRPVLTPFAEGILNTHYSIPNTEKGMNLKGKKTVVMGLGERSGPALASFLAKRGARVTVSERAPEEEVRARLEKLPPGVECECGGHVAETLRRADLVVLSPGVPPGLPVIEQARSAGVEIIGEVELAYRFIGGKVIGVTGTKGKGTTCTLLRDILRRAGLKVLLGGNIGTPLIELVEKAAPGTLVIAELSSFQLAAVESFRPWIAAVLNFYPDHLDRYRDEEEYRDDKLRLVDKQGKEDRLVLYRGLASREFFERGNAGERYYFDLAKGDFQGCFARGDDLVFVREGEETVLAHKRDVKLVGRHNLLNVLAALTLAGVIGVTPAVVAAGLDDFIPLPHRLEPVGEVAGVSYYDDSLGTNPAALGAALEALPGPLVLIAGGRYKGGDFTALRKAVRGKVKAALLIGEAAADIASAWEGATAIERHSGLAAAVKRAAELAAGAGGVLLSPGCSSLDMFRDYRERGRVFRQAVEEIAKQGNGGTADSAD